MNELRIVIDQTKIQIRDLKVKPGSEFPRPLAWWQKFVPCWLTASEGPHGNIVLTPNGRRADGFVADLTPSKQRRDVKNGLRWLGGLLYIDCSNAVIEA